MAHLLVAYDTVEGQTQKIAEYIADRARARGHQVTLKEVVSLAEHPVDEAYDGAIVGASIHVGHHSKRFVDFVEHRRMWLEGMPVAFYSVSLSASGSDEEQDEAEGYVSRLLSETGWRPQTTTTIAGSIRYRHYGFLKRFIMRRISKQAGRATDTSRDHEYTQWDVVDRFADSFLKQFPASDADP